EVAASDPLHEGIDVPASCNASSMRRIDNSAPPEDALAVILARSTVIRELVGVCAWATLLASCGSKPEPVTLIYPHGSSFRPGYLGKRAQLSEQFTRETGIQVKDIPVPESTREQLGFFRGLLEQDISGLDLFAIDTIWSKLLEADLADLRPHLAEE